MSKAKNQGVWGNNDTSRSVGDWDDVDYSSWSVRAKKGITEEFPSDTYDIPNPIKSTRETKGPSLSQEIRMKEWIKHFIIAGHCQCGTSCKAMWISLIALGISIWAIVS